MTDKYFREFLSLYAPRQGRALASVLISTFSGITKGSSFIMLLPLLSMAGLTEPATGEGSRALRLMAEFWGLLGIPFTLYSSLAVYLIMTALYAALSYADTMLASKIAESYTRSLRDQLFSAVLRAEWGFLKRSKSAHIFNNLITEVDKVAYSGQTVISMVTGALIFLFYLGTSLYVSFNMTLLAGLAFMPLLFVQRKLNWHTYNLGEAIYNRHETLFGKVMEFVNSLKLAKSYNLQARYEVELNAITAQTARENIRWSRVSAATDLLYNLGFALIISGLILWAFQYAQIPVVDLLLMVYIAMKLLPSIASLTQDFQFVISTLPAFSGIMKLKEDARRHKETPARGQDLPATLRGSIQFRDLCFGYEGDPPVLENFNAEIFFNQTTTLVGPSGRGKSTLVELLLGLLKPQSGQVLVAGTDLNDLNLNQWRGTTAYIPQECFLFHATIRENLLWVKADATDEEINEVLRAAAGDFVHELTHGLHTVVGDQGLRLSGGERQRIALARALLRKPKVLILDEASNALDKANEALIIDAIRQLNGKITIIIIAHDQTMSNLADQVIDLETLLAVPEPSRPK